jgi:monoamine oxidase
MSTPVQQRPRLAVIGGGISGLTAAYEALERGETNIHVYEASQRFGGKIQSGIVGGQTINRGAEFIDSEHTGLIGMARALGVPLVENTGMERETFQRPDGKTMDAEKFYDAYKPYAKQVMRDRALLQSHPHDARAQWIKNFSLDQYLDHLDAKLEAEHALPKPGLWQRVTRLFTNAPHPAREALAIAGLSFQSEMGQPMKNISAAQFIAETSPAVDTFLSSDCKFRVEGGTQALTDKLRETLEARGVTFHTGSALSTVGKRTDGGIDLGFASGDLVAADKTILALPSYAFKDITGLETLGLSPQALTNLRKTQYTNSFKLTIAFKPGMAPPEGAFYSTEGFQCWSPAPGLLTFLSNADMGGANPREFISARLEAFAKAHGKTADQMFDMNFTPGSFDYNNPGKAACYASPKVGQGETLAGLQSELPALAKNGIGIAGTYLPHDGGYGFMECGVVSAKRSCDLLIGPAKAVEAAHAKAPAVKQWVPHIEAQRKAAANDTSLQTAANAR